MRRWKRFKEYIRQKRLLRPDAAAFLLLLLGLYFFRMGNDWYSLKPDPSIALDNPYVVQPDGAGNTWVIDEERTRVVKINEEGRVEYLLRSNMQEADTFWYAEDLAFAPDGTVYLLDASWNDSGMAVARECILAYGKDGAYQNTLLDVLYEDEFVDKHRLYALTYYEHFLYYVESDTSGFSLFRVSADTGENEEVWFCSYENAFDLIQDYAVSPDGSAVYALDKRGRILKGDGAGLSLLYDTAKDSAYAGLTAFYRAAVDGDGTLYITDIRENKIYSFREGQESLEVYLDRGKVLSITSASQKEGDSLLGVWLDYGALVQNIRTGEETEGSSFQKSGSYLLRESGYQGAAVLVVLTTLWLLVRLLGLLSYVKMTEVQRTGILAAATAAVVAGVIVTQLLNQFASVYREELVSKLYIMAHTISGMVDADGLERIRTAEDYMGDDYQKLITALDAGLNREDSSVQEMYCNVLRYEDGKGFVIAYQDNSIGTYYPQDEAETAELAQIYRTGKEMQNDGMDNETGSYIYVRVPVTRSNGEIAGVIEVGTVAEIITNKVDAMRRSVMIMLCVVVLIVLFLFGEILSFFDLRSKYRKEQESGQQGMPLYMLRLVIFVTYMAFNVASSFLPVYAAGFVTDGMGIPRELAASLPITLNLIFIGLTSLFCAGLLQKFTFRWVAAVSACISMCGDAMLFAGQNYFWLVLGLILNGIGVGLITNSVNMFIAGNSREEVRQDGFSLFNAGSLSGINCGMMLGASLAGIVGQRKVFLCSALAWLLVAMLFLFMGKYMGGMQREKSREKKTGAFLASKGVIPYLALVQFPYVIINSFVFYYVPIYGDAQGFSENIVCLLLMLNSLCSVYLSVAVTDFMSRRFREWSIYLSSLLAFAGLLLFGWNSSVPMLIAVLLLLGVASSFGSAVRQTYFIKLPGVEAYGEESAMGIYNLMDNVGESAGPILFGSIMAGPSILPGLCGFVAVSGLVNGIHALVFGGGRRAKEDME